MGFTSWLAGGGVKGGMVEGATDEVGYKAVENPHYISDLQSTILRQVGLDYKKMDFVVNGRAFHLVEEGAGADPGDSGLRDRRCAGSPDERIQLELRAVVTMLVRDRQVMFPMSGISSIFRI